MKNSHTIRCHISVHPRHTNLGFQYFSSFEIYDSAVCDFLAAVHSDGQNFAMFLKAKSPLRLLKALLFLTSRIEDVASRDVESNFFDDNFFRFS